MKINYKNINQTFIENIENYIKIKRKIIDNTNIINAHDTMPCYIADLLFKNKKYQNIIKHIKLSILVDDDFYSGKDVNGNNIIKSPFFNGYFIIFKKNNIYFFSIYNMEILFYTFVERSKINEMECFCKRRFFL